MAIRSVIEQELLRVDERPEDILEGDLRVVLVLLEMREGDLHLFRHRLAAVDPAVEFLDLVLAGAVLLAGELLGAAAGDLVLNLAAVEQVQATFESR